KASDGIALHTKVDLVVVALIWVLADAELGYIKVFSGEERLAIRIVLGVTCRREISALCKVAAWTSLPELQIACLEQLLDFLQLVATIQARQLNSNTRYSIGRLLAD